MTFVDFVTPVPADWLNNVNTVVNTPVPANTAFSIPATVPAAFLPSTGYIKISNNPSNLTSFSVTSGQNYEAIAVDINGYGARAFGGIPNIVGITGAMNIPASASGGANAIGVAGYVKNSSDGTGRAGNLFTNGVALFGQADVEATGALVWGLNTVTQDNGFATTVWGAEIDVNITNPNTVVMGIDIVGGSTVASSNSIGVRIAPLGIFATPAIPWTRGVLVDDGAASTAIEIGATNTGSSPSGSQPITWYFYPSANTRALAGECVIDSSGNMTWAQGYSGALMTLAVGGAVGTALPAIKMQNASGVVALGFFGGAPTGKPTITGSISGSTTSVISEILVALNNLGLITNSTTA